MTKTPEDITETPEVLETPATPKSPELTDSRRRQALVVCIAAAFLTLLDVSIVTVALPSMEHNLRMSPADVSWAVAGYTLTFGLMLVPAGRPARGRVRPQEDLRRGTAAVRRHRRAVRGRA